MKRLALITWTLLIAVTAIAQPRRPGPPPGAMRGPDPLVEYLQLTTDQKASFETIHNQSRESMRALHEQERALHEQLENTTDANAAGALLLQLRNLREQMHAAHQAMDAKLAAVLTPEQQTKFAAFQAAAEFLRQRGPGGPPPPPR